MVEYRDEESGNHVIRVREYTEILIRALQKYYAEYEISEKKATVIAVASVLHDVGKVSIPNAILCKPGRLTSEEFSVMKEHTVRGYQMIQGSEGIWDDDYKKCTLEIV